ncbi:hypothetical protein ACOME3_003371 [Neoechinorhynchus agilis]
MSTEALNSGCKQVEKIVKSLRIDSVASIAFGTSRRAFENAFLNGDVRINSERLLNKARKISEGDTIDVLSDKSINTGDQCTKRHSRRVLVKNVVQDNGRFKVTLHVWKSGLLIDDVWS